MIKMNTSIKRIIAREGLVILVFLSLSLLAIVLNFIKATIALLETGMNFYGLSDTGFAFLYHLGFSLFRYIYPTYLIICFIIWAIKTLKEKV